MSPAIHNAAFRRLGLNWIYLAFPVHPSDLRGAVEGLAALGAAGTNVTMPHKETVVDLMNGLSEEALVAGAVNTIDFSSGRAVGHNTDVTGFASFLAEDTGFSSSGSSALVLGAGGAARAVVAALDATGVKSVTVAGRMPDKARAVAGIVRRAETNVVALEDAAALAGRCDLVVNATPVGAGGEDVLAGADFSPGQVVIDLLYDPPATPLIARARAAGAEAWSGLGHLVHQAGDSFRIWTGAEPPLEVMSAAALRNLGSRRGEAEPNDSTWDLDLPKQD